MRITGIPGCGFDLSSRSVPLTRPAIQLHVVEAHLNGNRDRQHHRQIRVLNVGIDDIDRYLLGSTIGAQNQVGSSGDGVEATGVCRNKQSAAARWRFIATIPLYRCWLLPATVLIFLRATKNFVISIGRSVYPILVTMLTTKPIIVATKKNE